MAKKLIPLNDILYVYAIPSWKPSKVTPFQGFAPGLIAISPFFRTLVKLPADILELSLDISERLIRRRAGLGSWLWSPVNVETLIRYRRPSIIQPFMVVFTADAEVARRVSVWRRNLQIRPLHVSSIKNIGALPPQELTIEKLRQYCLSTLWNARSRNRQLDVEDSVELIKNWQHREERASSLRLHSHNVTLPNEMVLQSVGEALAKGEEGHLNVSAPQKYVDGISESAQAVMAVQAQTDGRLIYKLHPPAPDIILFAPATYKGIEQEMGRRAPLPAQVKVLRALERQQHYTMEIASNEQDLSDIRPILLMRSAELKLQSLIVGIRASATLAATIRTPPAVNRTVGVVGHLARHLRTYDNNLPKRKTARVFKLVQDSLAKSIPAEHLELLSKSRSGVKIVGNAPLEWLPINGLPLGIRADVSRINVTPGNLMIEQIRPALPQYMPSTAFQKYLVVSMFDTDDNLATHVMKSLEVLPGAQESNITGIRATPRTTEEFLETLNAYNGAILIVDSHGAHPQNPDVGGLIIGGKPVDIWTLHDKIKVPPIVILSACDTHPFDRSHATVGNGFLLCGAVAVLATVLPIRGRAAAIFLARLMLRAIKFADLSNQGGQSVPWTNIVGGALRMQLASDVVRGLMAQKLLSEEQAEQIQISANYDINLPRADWFERLAQRCSEACKLTTERWQSIFDDILATSDVIRYVHLGNPETILISDNRVTENMMSKIH